jgi:hypothetical protein
MTIRLERSEPGATTDRSPADLRGTWTIDPATSTGSLARRTLGRWTITGRRHCVGVIHLDALPADLAGPERRRARAGDRFPARARPPPRT